MDHRPLGGVCTCATPIILPKYKSHVRFPKTRTSSPQPLIEYTPSLSLYIFRLVHFVRFRQSQPQIYLLVSWSPAIRISSRCDCGCIYRARRLTLRPCRWLPKQLTPAELTSSTTAIGLRWTMVHHERPSIAGRLLVQTP
jgi:hypothetical protein